MRGNEFQINYGGEWLDVDAQSVGGFDFTTLWTLDSTRHIQRERYLRNRADRRETLGDAFKSTALRWLRKQPKMKTCRLEDIEKMERVWSDDGKRRFEITAKGKRYTIR